MKVNKFGTPIYSDTDVLEFLYQGNLDILNKISVEQSDEIDKLNSQLKNLNIYQERTETVKDFDQTLQVNWLMPDSYKTLDIEGYLVSVCPKENYQRLIDELCEFRDRNMLDLLRWLKYFVDTCRKNGIVWGVGRGSSVSSYVLFLIGVHRIDSIKYKLDWREFLR